ncbi:MAG TPA: hypothetical protein VGC50_14495 [Gammaproteobacteria bacterium]
MRKLAVSLALTIAACGGSSTDPPMIALPPPGDLSPGGLWEGTHTNGDYILGLIGEDGEFHFVDDFGQGYGVMSVDGDQVAADYTHAAYLGETFEDGSVIAACTLSGTLVERDVLTFTSECITGFGTESEVTLSLAFNDNYFRDGSLDTLAGQFDDLGNVLTIDSNGVLFEQDPASGCVMNGQVSVIDPDFNAYAMEFIFESCEGEVEFLNGSTWSGIGALDHTNLVGPEKLVFGATTEIDFPGEGTEAFAIEGVAPRL